MAELTPQFGPAAKDFLSGKRKLMMDFRQKSPIKIAWNKQKTTVNSKRAPAAPSRGRIGQADLDTFGGNGQTIPRISNPVARKRSLQQIQAEEDAFDKSGWGDTDDEGEGGNDQRITSDPIVLSGEETETDEKSKKKARNSAPAAVGTMRKEVAGGGALARRRTIGATASGGIKSSATQSMGTAPKIKQTVGTILNVDDDADVDRSTSRSPVDQCCQALRRAINDVRDTLFRKV